MTRPPYPTPEEFASMTQKQFAAFLDRIGVRKSERTTTPNRKHWRLEVLWEDSTVWQRGWEKIDEVIEDRDAVRCLSVGFVLADDDRGMVLAASIHGDEAAGIAMIPRSAIVSSRRLR